MKKILFLGFIIIIITGCANKQSNSNQIPFQDTTQAGQETSKELDETIVPKEPQNKSINIDEQEECDTSNITDKSKELVAGQKVYCVKDNQIYHNGVELKNADLDSFEVLYIERGNTGIAKDKNHIYRGINIMPDIDAKTFIRLERNYFKDKNSVYRYMFGFEKLNFLDVNSFEVLGGPEGSYVKDKNFVYQDIESLEKIKDADPKTFNPDN